MLYTSTGFLHFVPRQRSLVCMLLRMIFSRGIPRPCGKVPPVVHSRNPRGGRGPK